jgi:transposase
MKRAVATARLPARAGLAAPVREAFSAPYDRILVAGLRGNPPPAPPGERGRPKRGTAGSLGDRLIAPKEAPRAFTGDFAVPLANNLGERDIRMPKVREKISGCFRPPDGAARFRRIRGHLATLRKQGMPILPSPRQAIAGNPPFPVTTWRIDLSSYVISGYF